MQLDQEHFAVSFPVLWSREFEFSDHMIKSLPSTLTTISIRVYSDVFQASCSQYEYTIYIKAMEVAFFQAYLLKCDRYA